MKTRYIIIFFMLFAIKNTCFAESLKVGLIYNVKSRVHSTIASNIKKKLSKKNMAFFEVSTHDAPEEIISQINNSNLDYIFSIGKKYSLIAKKTYMKGVFILCFDPVKYGLVDENNQYLTNLHGLSLHFKPSMQFELLNKILPEKKIIGVVYNPQNTSHLVDQLVREGESLNYSFVMKSIDTPAAALPAYYSMKGKIDVIFLVMDPIFSNLMVRENLIKFSITNKIPLVGSNAVMTKEGALFSFHYNPSDVVNQAAKMLVELGNGGLSSKKELEYLETINYSINKKTAKIMKIKIPKSIVNNATNIFK